MADRFVTADESAWKAVATAIDARMAELGIDQRTVVSRAEDAGAKLSQSSLGKLLAAKELSYRPTTLRVASRALGWTGDSIERVLQGQPPSIAHDDTSIESRLLALEHGFQEVRETLSAIADQLDDVDVPAPLPRGGRRAP